MPTQPIPEGPTRLAFADGFAGLLARRNKVASVVGIACLLLLATVVVYLMGGSKYVYPHFFYVPIVVAAACFGLPGGLSVALAASLLCGPLMPLDVATGQAQPLAGWLVRTGFFLLIGVLGGAVCQRMAAQLSWIREHAYRQPLTRLPAKPQLREDLKERLEQDHDGDGFALGVLSVSSCIGDISDTFGLEIGDLFLQNAAIRLAENLTPEDRLYHLDGADFAILFAENADAWCTERRLKALTALLRAPIEVGGISIRSDIHAGLVHHADNPLSANDLIRAALTALHHAQRLGRDWHLYEKTTHDEQEQAVRLLCELPAAIAEDQLVLHYQPKIDLQSGRCVGVEALVRWHHPVHGLIPPGRFIPYVEQSSMIRELTQWVMETAVIELGRWRSLGLDLSIAVNLSTRNLEADSLRAVLAKSVEVFDLQSNGLEIEITEHGLIEQPQMARRVLDHFKILGARIALDDFGTGYSSLAHLKDLPIDTLKIDQSFVRELCTEPKHQRIVRAIIGMAHDLGLDVVAEGVEDEDALAWLRLAGCDQAQGYHIARPLPADDFLAWLRADPSRQPAQPAGALADARTGDAGAADACTERRKPPLLVS